MIDYQAKIDNVRISSRKSLIPAGVVIEEHPATRVVMDTVVKSRQAISNVLHGKDDRLVIIVGPCSVHDVDAAREYANLLYKMSLEYQQELIVVMRVYFEKPRTTVGWKGLINDPDLNNSFQINKGLRLSRQLLLDICQIGLPCATEFLDVISPQYISDLISWGAIGARTTESQIHRELASGLSCPVGFKNATNGAVSVAVDAIKASKSKHHFLSVSKQGTTAIFETCGNDDSHIILRGGDNGPNYSKDQINEVLNKLAEQSLPNKIMVDCSHGNSNKDYTKQTVVVDEICKQLSAGSHDIMGVMIESNLKAGNQSIFISPLEYGKSITDACVDMQETEQMLAKLAAAVNLRRNNS